MFVDLLQRRVFEGLISAFLRLPLLDFIEGGGPVLHELDAGELFQDPALRRVECKLGLFRLHSFVHCTMRSSFSTSAPGSSATLSIKAKTAVALSNGGAARCSTCSIRIPPSPA